ncbi:MAG: glycosyltransferase [Clostridiales bacterium]|nr:glycosyltransferase [Clostridiales bacterium]
MIKILFFIPNLSSGGAEKVLRSLVNHMDQNQFDITVQTIEKEQSENYLVEGIHYKSINHSRTGFGRKIFSYWFRLLAELKLIYPLYIKGDCDIEVAYLECDATKVMAASTSRKALKVAWVHCDLSKKEGISENAVKIKKYYEKYDKVVCVSEDARMGFVSLFGSEPESLVLGNVIDEKEILQKSEKPLPVLKDVSVKTFVAVGRLTWQKGFDRLIEIFSTLRDEKYPVHLWILGEGPERENLERLIEQYQLKDVIDLMGFQENPYPFIKAADCVVCSSRYEGISTVVTEALILGKPVVTTPCTGMKELLGNSEYGIIAEDTEEGLLKSIKSFLDSGELRQHYTNAASNRGKMFSKANSVRVIQNFFVQESKKKRI